MPTPEGFLDFVFPLDVVTEGAVSLQYQTSVVSGASGYEQRNQVWDESRYRFDLDLVQASRLKTSVILALGQLAAGRAKTFLLLNPIDYQVLEPTAMQMRSATVGQLRSRFGYGGFEVFRRLLWPSAGSVRVWDGGSELVSGWTLDRATGLVTFASAPAAPTFTCNLFHTRVRFSEDAMAFRVLEGRATTVDALGLVEVREPDAA